MGVRRTVVVAAVLALLADPPPGTAFEPEARAGDDGTFTVVTYNVGGIFTLLSNPFLTRKWRYRRIAPKLNTYDLVLLQEFFGKRPYPETRTHFQQHLLAGVDHRHQVVAKGPMGFAYDSGLASLSRLPVINSELHHYETCAGRLIPWAGSDCLAVKGFLFQRVQHDDGEIHVYTTHLDASKGRNDARARIAQLAQLEAFVDQVSAGFPVIVGGDFNTIMDKESVSRCRRLRGEDCDSQRLIELRDRLELSELCPGAACDRTLCPDAKLCGPAHIDHLFFRSGEHVELSAEAAWWDSMRLHGASGVRLSDHPALGARFTVERKDR